ncbi:phosphoribosylamine--glycine ligase [Streptomyces sp. NPDC002992]|uniref:phosphoribosylamine--glycine ligase n=1 Tax=Streptomyces sp. NPDC002992 TaxID=3154273 RepID=UPI0033B4D381
MKRTDEHTPRHHRVLVVDGTGRGHAVCELFTRTDPDVVVYYGPGCDVIEHDRIIPVSTLTLTNPRPTLEFLAEHPVDFVFISNIDALSRGYVEILRAFGHRVIGPTAEAAELESSKERGKRFCLDHGIPTAAYQSFTDPEAAKEYIRSLSYACVVKIDVLTPDGDGAVVCDTAGEATAAVDAFARTYGEQFKIVVEQRLTGQELSVFALLDGESALLFPTAMDFKRTLEQDAGGNCDGMGSIAPHPADDEALRQEIRTVLLEPLMRGIAADGLDFTGFVYLGTMITDAGLRVIEINARFGDSEAEVVLPGVQSSFTALCEAVLERRLHLEELTSDGLARCSVALTQGCLDPSDPQALPGWPFGAFETGQEVHGLAGIDPAEADVFYANLRRDAAGTPVTSGGRVLHVVGRGATADEARRGAYRQLAHVSFRGMRYRDDIGAEPAVVVPH